MLRRMANGWRSVNPPNKRDCGIAHHRISNYAYILRLNALAGRTLHDISHYPVLPWVLSNYHSSTPPDLSDPSNFRTLSKPMGALDSHRLDKFIKKYHSLSGSNTEEDSGTAFMYGSHYSTGGGVVLHYLVRVEPFSTLHRTLHGQSFDVPDRLFSSIENTWRQCSRDSPTEVKELTPEWFTDPRFLECNPNLNLGRRINGEIVRDVELPPWANSPLGFTQTNARALESDVCSNALHEWLDLIFGEKQRGQKAKRAMNLFHHLTYVDCEADWEILRECGEEEWGSEAKDWWPSADFGRCPGQLFMTAHPKKKRKKRKKKSGDGYTRSLIDIRVIYHPGHAFIFHLSNKYV